jgi:hypothetical protein
MRAYKCDRCGAFYGGLEPIAQEAMDVVDVYGNKKHILLDDWDHNQRVDLCIDCSLDLKTWWEAGQAVKEEEK